MKGGLLLNVVVAQSAAIFELFAGKDQTLLIWRNAFLVLNLGLNIVDGIAGLNLKGDGLASHCEKRYQLLSYTRQQSAGRFRTDELGRIRNLQVFTKICMMTRI